MGSINDNAKVRAAEERAMQAHQVESSKMGNALNATVETAKKAAEGHRHDVKINNKKK
ncbi:MAG: hypothetical protein KKA19_01765 [Candidatus Margulisbacteria bacterium]|nr:hypothetical protein [Candidatus Margulisiibacteriota bacterium]